MNSNNVFKLSGDGAVTKMLLNPKRIAAAIPMPIAADLPRPLPAVNDTVVFDVFSLSTSTSVMMTLAWSRVLALANSYPITYFVARLFLSPSNS